jgi:CBS domain-containing protein
MPAASLLALLADELRQHPPFDRIAPAALLRLLAQSRQAYFAPDERLLSPEHGQVQALYLIRRGSVTGRHPPDSAEAPVEYGPGDLFPVGAALAGRAVRATYSANEDCFCLLLPLPAMQALAAESGVFADFLNHRVAQFLAQSRQAVQAAWSSMALAEQSLEARLSTLPRRTPLAVAAATPLALALQQMHERRVGSVLVLDHAGAPQGILTRHDILGRVTLPQRPLATPIGEVMSQPVWSLDEALTLQDAALLMSRHGIRHVPVTASGRLVNIVSERDLFALQRLSIKQLGVALRSAADLATLRGLAADIRRLAANLLGQGLRARQLTELISHLNDRLTERLVTLLAAQQGLDLRQACWLALGSEGRGEQTIATDQDNGLVFQSTDPAADRPRWLAFGAAVNQALADCGYPLCSGGVMAGEAACCLSVDEWLARFDHWIEHGAPEDLLNASIFFDLRPLAGQLGIAAPLQAFLRETPPRVPRFLKQLALNGLQRPAPLNWRGALDTEDEGGRAWLDLKLQGTAIFVEAARLYALAQGLPALSTRDRLLGAAPGLGVPAPEAAAWVEGFEFLQLLRLQVQMQPGGDPGRPNRIDVHALNPIDQRMLKEALRMAQQVQQRLALDYQR